MDTLREWSGFLCFSAIGCCAVGLLIPKEGVGKVFRLLLVTFFLCSLVMPLLNIGSTLSLDVDFLPQEIVSQALNEKVTEQLQRQVEATVSDIVAECLSYREVTAEKILVQTTTSENGSIYIQQVTITVDKQKLAAAQAVRDVLETQLGTDVVIQAGG